MTSAADNVGASVGSV